MEDSSRGDARQRQQIRSPYLPLSENHIRLLRIHRISTGPSFNFDIRTEIHALTDGTQYTALSYCWGPASDNRLVTLDGNIDCPLGIRLNLWHFFNAITESTKTSDTLFWIDAVSINQADLQERSKQVQLMPQIYSGAYRVLIWLGPAAQGSDRAMDFLMKVPTLGVSKILKRLWTTAAGAALAELCHRPYWSRLWVVQELMLGHDLEMMCGRHSVPWSAVHDIYQHAAYDDPPGNLSRSRMTYMRTLDSPGFAMVRRVASKGRERSLLSLVLESSDLKCAEVLDKVYALLGLSTSTIRVDYAANVTELLNAILREHYNSHVAADMTEIRKVCCDLSRCLIDTENAIFQLPVSRLPKAPSESILCSQCRCTKHYLQHAQAPIRAEPSACWIEAYDYHWMLEHLFTLDERTPDELMILIVESNCRTAIRWLAESVAFLVADEVSHYQQWVSWASRVNLLRFVVLVLERPEHSFKLYDQELVGYGGEHLLREAFVNPVNLIRRLILWLRDEFDSEKPLPYHALKHVRSQDYTRIAIQQDQVGLLPRHIPVDYDVDASQGEISIPHSIDKDHAELIERLFILEGINTTAWKRGRHVSPLLDIRQRCHPIVAKLLMDTNVDQTTRSESSLLELIVEIGDVKLVQSVLKFRRCPTRTQELVSLEPMKMAYRLERYEILEELEKAYEAAIERIVMRSLELESPHAGSEFEEIRCLWPLILNKWSAHTRIRYQGKYHSDTSSRFRSHSAICDVTRVAERLNMSVLELGSDHRGRTPLHHAVLDSDASGVRAIISSGAQRINIPDKEGKTVLFYALARGCRTIASILLDSEAIEFDDAITQVLWDLSPTPRPMLDGRFDPRQSLAQMGAKDWDVLRVYFEYE